MRSGLIGLRRLARDVRDRHDAFHGAGMRQLRIAHDNIADGVNSRLGRAHELVDLHEAAVQFDLRLLDADVRGHRSASHRDQHLLGFQLLRLAIDGEGNGDTRLGLFHLLHLGIHKAIDAALPIHAHQLLRHFLVFDGNVTRQHLEDSDVGSRTIYRCWRTRRPPRPSRSRSETWESGPGSAPRCCSGPACQPAGRATCGPTSRWRV